MESPQDPLQLALARHLAGDLAQAEQLYRQILAQQPLRADAVHLLGALASQRGKHDEALQLLRQAVELAPDSPLFLGNLGTALLLAGRHGEARPVLERAIQLAPHMPDPRYNLGVVLSNLGLVEEAASSYQQAIFSDPHEPRSYNNLVGVYHQLGMVNEALEACEKALKLAPQHDGAHYNRALTWLKLGRLPAAWHEYEWRWNLSEFPRRFDSLPQWDGQPSADLRLLVWAEQGLGDTLQWIRYWPLVQQRCPRAVVCVPTRLLQLLGQSGLTGLVGDDQPLPTCDAQIPLTSLPRVFETSLDTIPCETPYLHADPIRVARWQAELASCGEFRVGIAWQGNPAFREDRYRSIPLEQFEPLAKVPNVRLVCLQQGPGIEQIGGLRESLGLIEPAAPVDLDSAFVDTAAIIGNLDLVVCSDTAMAHLAGALGAKVWLALAIGPDWRWFIDRTDSPWYPTMRLFRQRKFNDWSSVFADMVAELAVR